MAEVITFKEDGTYDKVLYGQMSIKGDWRFNQDAYYGESKEYGHYDRYYVVEGQ